MKRTKSVRENLQVLARAGFRDARVVWAQHDMALYRGCVGMEKEGRPASQGADLEQQFLPTHNGVFMSREGGAGRGAEYSEKKLCFVATDKAFLVSLLYELSLREDCSFVKYSVKPRDGMYLGRCFLTSEVEAARLCQSYKAHPKLMVTLQDDAFFNAYRE